MSTDPGESASPQIEANTRITREVKPRDIWDKMWALGPAIFGAAGVAITAMVNIHDSDKRRTQAAVEIMNQREQSEMDFRAKIFEALLGRLFKHDDPAEQVTVLRLFQHNFHEMFNGRAFFDRVAALADSAAMRASDRRSLLRELNSIAREVSVQQERIVESNVHNEFPPLWVPAGDSATVVLSLGKDKRNQRSLQFTVKEGCDLDGEHDRPDHKHLHRVCIVLESVYPDTVMGGDSVRLRLRFDSARENRDSIDIPPRFRPTEGPIHFSVSYFDTPFTDNTLMPDGHRLAIVLKGADSSGARLKVIEFPADYIVSGYRPSVHLVREMLAHTSE